MESPKEIMRFAVAEVQKSSSRVRINAEDFISKIPGEVIFEILQRESKKYPKLDFSKEQVEESILEKINKDFPQITTQKDVIDKSEMIAKYYDKLLRDDLIKELSKVKLENASGQFFDGFNPPDGWAWIGIIYPTTASVVVESAINASFFTNAHFGQNDDGEKSNAFRHSVWNALSVGGMRSLGYSRSTSWDNVRTVTSAYESVGVSPSWSSFIFPGFMSIFGDINIIQKRGESNAMDLNNNLIGRTYMHHNMGFWPWQTPSAGAIVAEMFTKANNIGFNSNQNSILMIYHPNIDEAWERLYVWPYDDDYRELVKLR